MSVIFLSVCDHLFTLYCWQAITISLGNKCDLKDSKQVDFNTANKWAQTEKGNLSDACNVLDITTLLQPFTALWILSGTTRLSQYQKGKTNLYFLEQETVSGSGASWAICNASIPPLGFLQAKCPSYHPSNSVKALKAKCYIR